MSAPVPFKSLFVGAAFRFACESGVGGLAWQGARGPWVKVGGKSYRAIENGQVCGPTYVVGTVAAKVVREESGQ